MDGVAVKPLTVGFSNLSFLAALNEENRQPFWFQLAPEEQAEVGEPWGPANPQALNRYAYVLNNPVKYTDPTGHCPQMNHCTDGGGGLRGQIPPGTSVGGRAGGGGNSGGSGNGAGRGGNRPSPDPRAEGPHSVPHRDPDTGKVTKYTTFQPQSNPQNPNPWEIEKRFRADGPPHYNKATREEIAPPLVHERGAPGGVRSARPDEIPGGPR